MTLRFLRLLACQLLLLFACAQARAAEGVEITQAYIESGEEGYRLVSSYAFDLSSNLEESIQFGVELNFITEIELTRPRWYWYDDKAVSIRRTVNLSYHTLTRQYLVRIPGSMQQSFQTLDDAMVLIRRPSRWLIAPRGALKRGENYNVSMRMYMELPKTMQVNALNNADWRLSSKNKNFSYRAE